MNTHLHFGLIKYFLNLYRFERKSVNEIKKIQLQKFNALFEHAKKHSPFYKRFYKEAGVYDMQICSFEDIQKIPLTDKALLRDQKPKDLLTVPIDSKNINVHSTSGSTGVPFKVYYNNHEDYSAHCRVFFSLLKMGYNPFKKITMIARYEPNDTFEIENELKLLSIIQKKLGVFNRAILSIYDPPDKIINRILESKPKILWSTPSIIDIIISRLKQRGIKLHLPVVFFTSESISDNQLKNYRKYIARKVVDIYGLAECPTMTAAYDDMNIKQVFSDSVLVEFIDKDRQNLTGTPVITNLINHTMPFIRYKTGDTGSLLEHDQNFPTKVIGRINGRIDDLLELKNGQKFAHHHAYEMFMDFHEVEMFRFVQNDDELILQLKIDSRLKTEQDIEKMAKERWAKRFPSDLLKIQFVDEFKVDPKTGKFRNIIKYEN